MRQWDETNTLSRSVVHFARSQNPTMAALPPLRTKLIDPEGCNSFSRHHQHHQLVPRAAQHIQSPSCPPTLRILLLKSSVAVDMCRVPAALKVCRGKSIVIVCGQLSIRFKKACHHTFSPLMSATKFHTSLQIGLGYVAVDQLNTLHESKQWKIHGSPQS